MGTAPRGMDWRPIGALVAVGGILLLVGAGRLWWHYFRPLPSDALLRERFHDHRAQLDQLAAMARADTQLVGASHDPMLMRFTVFVRDTPSSRRLLTDGEARATGRTELGRFLDRAGLPAISRSADGNTVWFVAASSTEARKGFVFSLNPLAPVRSSLDGLDRGGPGYALSGYVPLAPRWFMFLEPSD
jgi:hypothetical protein